MNEKMNEKKNYKRIVWTLIVFLKILMITQLKGGEL